MQNQPEWEVQCEGLLQALPPEMEPICDSRGEVKDKIFVCIKGDRHDGHTYAAGVLRRGAAAIVTQKKLGLPREYTVPDTRAALARLCARYWGEPAKELRIIGITGTNGKTTTAHLLCHLLQSAGIKTGRIGTDGIVWGEKTQPNPYTTPPPTELHRILHQMVEDGITTVVMEVPLQSARRGWPRQPGQGIRLRRLLASHQRRVSLRIRRAADRRQTALRSDRHHQREAFDARRAARMPSATDPQSVRGGIEPIARQMPQSAQRGSRVAGNSTVCYKRGVYH